MSAFFKVGNRYLIRYGSAIREMWVREVTREAYVRVEFANGTTQWGRFGTWMVLEDLGP